MRRDSLDELTRAGELHRRNLTPANTIFKLASIEEVLAARAREEREVHVAVHARWGGRLPLPPGARSAPVGALTRREHCQSQAIPRA
jgi:hypothetical protein